MHASLENTSWEKRLHKQIALDTTHEITDSNSGEFNLPQAKNCIAGLYFSEPTFRICKKNLT